jgi:ABC-type sugar transport system permease subunit
MLGPTVLVYTVFIIISVIITVYYSFTKYSGIGRARWLGFDNYRRILSDPYFLMALKNSFLILLISLVILITLGFLLALFFKRRLLGHSFCKATIFAPAIIAPIIVGIIWIFILDPEIGIINSLLRTAGRDDLRQLWIGGGKLDAFSFSLVFFWRQLGYLATIFLTGLNLISDEIYESAAIAGATSLQQMWYITIPMMKQTFTITVLLVITEVFKIFEIVLQLTNGGPNHLSEVLVTYTYTTTFKGGEYGYGMSLATVTFLITLIFSLAYMIIIGRGTGESK